jgi:hypothetical protein
MLRADWQVCEICFACQEIQSTHSSHYFRPEDLYDLVWTSPVSEVAARLGVSDVALAKLCRRAAIPRPGRGYWQRTESGQLIGQTPLPTAPAGLPELLRIRGKKPAIHSPKQVAKAKN